MYGACGYEYNLNLVYYPPLPTTTKLTVFSYPFHHPPKNNGLGNSCMELLGLSHIHASTSMQSNFQKWPFLSGFGMGFSGSQVASGKRPMAISGMASARSKKTTWASSADDCAPALHDIQGRVQACNCEDPAKRVFSVTMRKGPCVDKPTPPPIVMPSKRLTWQQPAGLEPCFKVLHKIPRPCLSDQTGLPV